MSVHRLTLLVFGAVLCCLQSALAEKKYGYVFAPRYITPGTNYVVTVDLFNFLEIKSGTYDVTAAVKIYTYSSTSLTDVVEETESLSDSNPRGDITLQIPDDIDPNGSSYRVYVNVAANGVNYGESTIYVSLRHGSDDTILIQTDKGLYKAGQTVQFRVMSVNAKRIVEVKPLTIEIFDGDNNRVRRWANVSDNSGVFVGKMEMSQYPILGTWSIRAKSDDMVKSQMFEVKEFELPKFDLTIDIPDVVSTYDMYLEGTVSSMYTFGKGVTGSVEVVFESAGKTFSKIYKLTDGEVEIRIELSDIEDAFGSLVAPRSTSTMYYDNRGTGTIYDYFSSSTTPWTTNGDYDVEVRATVTEDITGNTRQDSVSIRFVKFNVDIRMERKSTGFFRPGQSPNTKGQVTSITGSAYDGPAADDYLVTVSVVYKKTGSVYLPLIAERNVTIDNRNRFSFSIDENLITENMREIKAEIKLISKRTRDVIRTENDYFFRATSTDGNFILVQKLSGSDPLSVGETANYRIKLSGEGTVTATYRVMSKGVVVKSGPWFSLSENDPYDFEIRATAKMVPSFIVLAWFILPKDRLIIWTSGYVGAGAIQTYVKDSEIQDTSITFQQMSVRPGDNARLDLKSTSRSTFYVLAVDKSILLLDKGNDITESILPDLNTDPISAITDSQASTSIIYGAGMNVHYIELRDPYSSTYSSSISTWYDDYYYSYAYSYAAYAASYAASTSGVYASSKSTSSVRTTTSGPQSSSLASSRSQASDKNIGEPVKQETIRKKFPDTWLFINATADSSGRASIVRKVPDTVTTWVASCFAVSAESKITTAARKAELEVFLPFFISLQLPFSVIRNEQLVLQANIFNYHTKDLYVLVTLKKSSMFRGLAVVKRGRRRVLEERCGNVVLCIFAKAGRGTAAFFPIVPTEIGKIKITITADSSSFKDTVIKYLRVESEGAPKDVAYPFLVDLRQETTFFTHFDLNYPPNTVDGSQRMRVTLIGDIMGPTIDGLDKLIKHPYGCGEQNMISTAPSVFVYRYLSAVGKLTNELKEKAENFMRIGMQRQLTYRHTDWSFSAWGGSGSGSTWLTAFVLKVFSMASSYVEIDDQIVTKSADWLTSIQKADGSFPEKGNVNSRSLQGGATGTVERMTAYVLIALLEGRKASSNVEFCAACLNRLDTAIQKASNFLANNLDNQTSVFTVAISTYALTLAEHNQAWRARNMLDDLSKGGAGQKYWEEASQPPVSKYHYGPSTQAVSIEMTAYGLLAFVESGNTIKSLLIQKWLIGQRNPYGGFISTQDTVIALQALSELGAKVNADDPNMTIMFSYTDTRLRKKRFNINARNAMNMQIQDISSDTKTISMHAWGTKGSTAILTVSLFYNIMMDIEDRSLRLEVTVQKETINGFTLRSCVSWLEQDVSGMIVVEVGIPSGFEANRWGISTHNLLMRTEIEERKVILYYDEVTYTEICTNIPVVRDKMVANIKPVPCKAYEYYEPSNEVTVFYVPLSAKNANICDICGAECGCKTSREKLWFPQSWCRRKI